jgi:hypothetical protein
MIHVCVNLFILRREEGGLFSDIFVDGDGQTKAHFSPFWQGDGSTFFTLLTLSNEATVFLRLSDMDFLPSDY